MAVGGFYRDGSSPARVEVRNARYRLTFAVAVRDRKYHQLQVLCTQAGVAGCGPARVLRRSTRRQPSQLPIGREIGNMGASTYLFGFRVSQDLELHYRTKSTLCLAGE